MLHVHRAERADALVEALAGLLADPPADPFAPEVVAVPTRGMERWLTQRMSGRLGATPGRADGVCANVAFPSPRRLVGDAVATASGIDAATDPWLPERAVWPLLEVVDGCLDEPWLESLATHLGATAPTPPWTRRAGRAGSRSCATSPISSTATRCTGPRWSAHGPPDATRTARAVACGPTSAGRPSCGGACARASPCPTRPSASMARARGSATTPPSSTSPDACRCSA